MPARTLLFSGGLSATCGGHSAPHWFHTPMALPSIDIPTCRSMGTRCPLLGQGLGRWGGGEEFCTYLGWAFTLTRAGDSGLGLPEGAEMGVLPVASVPVTMGRTLPHAASHLYPPHSYFAVLTLSSSALPFEWWNRCATVVRVPHHVIPAACHHPSRATGILLRVFADLLLPCNCGAGPLWGGACLAHIAYTPIPPRRAGACRHHQLLFYAALSHSPQRHARCIPPLLYHATCWTLPFTSAYRLPHARWNKVNLNHSMRDSRTTRTICHCTVPTPMRWWWDGTAAVGCGPLVAVRWRPTTSTLHRLEGVILLGL